MSSKNDSLTLISNITHAPLHRDIKEGSILNTCDVIDRDVNIPENHRQTHWWLLLPFWCCWLLLLLLLLCCWWENLQSISLIFYELCFLTFSTIKQTQTVIKVKLCITLVWENLLIKCWWNWNLAVGCSNPRRMKVPSRIWQNLLWIRDS